MEKILIIHTKDEKNIATKLQQTLRSNGFSSSVGTFKGEVTDSASVPNVAIAVIANEFADDADLIESFNNLQKSNVNVVLFVTKQLQNNVVNNFFLDEHVWIDNVSQSLDESQKDLVDLFKRNYSELSKTATKKKNATKQQPKTVQSSKVNSSEKSSKPSKNESLYRNLLMISGVVILVLLLLLVNGGLKQTNREAEMQQANLTNAAGNSNIKIQLSSDLKRSESMLVGHWYMSEYTDNQFRATRDDSIALQGIINALVSRAQLVFNANKTFSRIGFGENTETGNWEYDPQTKYLKLQPTGVNQYDVVQIQEVNEQNLVIVVSEKVDQNQIITKMTFKKN